MHTELPAFRIPPISVNSALGKTILKAYRTKLWEHQKEVRTIAQKAYSAAKAQFMVTENYKPKPSKKEIKALLDRVEQATKDHPYIWLDNLVLELETGKGILSNLYPIPRLEISDLCKLERLFKPSIETAETLLNHLKDTPPC